MELGSTKMFFSPVLLAWVEMVELGMGKYQLVSSN
jgi:hypothetical protein